MKIIINNEIIQSIKITNYIEQRIIINSNGS